MDKQELEVLAKAAYGESARVRINRAGAVAETFERGEVLVVRHPDHAVAMRIFEAALRAA